MANTTTNKRKVGYSLTPEACRIVERIATEDGISRASVIEISLRRFEQQWTARNEGAAK